MGGNMIVSWIEQAVTRMDLRMTNLEYSLATLTGRLEAVEKQAVAEPPEPPPDLEATIRSLHESNEGLRNLLADAKQTERDLDAEVARLTKENQRLTQLAWRAETEKAATKALAEELAQRTLERDDLARRLKFECEERAAMRDERDALSVRIADERRALLSLLGVTNEEG